jgi:hypothetical protein
LNTDAAGRFFVKPVRNGAGVNQLTYTPSSGEISYGAAVSDRRLKSNIELANLQTCYDIIKTIDLKRYRFYEDVYEDLDCTDRSRLGWIAQEVETVLPKSINTQEFKCANGTVIQDCLSLDPSQLYASMYGAIKMLITKVETLEAKNKEGNV